MKWGTRSLKAGVAYEERGRDLCEMGYQEDRLQNGNCSLWHLPHKLLFGFLCLVFFFRQSSCPFLASLLLTVAEYKGYFWCNSPISCLLISHKFSCWSVSWLWESHSPKCYSQQGFLYFSEKIVNNTGIR